MLNKNTILIKNISKIDYLDIIFIESFNINKIKYNYLNTIKNKYNIDKLNQDRNCFLDAYHNLYIKRKENLIQ